MTTLTCPRCGSLHIQTRHIGRKTGGTVGAVAGGASGIAGALQGARVGLTVGFMAGPAGAAFGAVAGAFLGCVCGMAIGGEVGSGIGGLVDRHLLDNHACLDCGHTFSADTPPDSGPDARNAWGFFQLAPIPSGPSRQAGEPPKADQPGKSDA